MYEVWEFAHVVAAGVSAAVNRVMTCCRSNWPRCGSIHPQCLLCGAGE